MSDGLGDQSRVFCETDESLVGAEGGRLQQESLNTAGFGNELFLLFGEKGEALAECGVGGFERAVGLEDLRKEPVPHNCHHKQDMIIYSGLQGSS